MSPATMIVFLFLGHSNLDNACAGNCTPSILENVWAYGDEKKIYRPTNLNSGMYIFLNDIATRYPGYNFCGVDLTSPSQFMGEYVPGTDRYNRMKNAVSYLRTVSTIGGMVLMYGVNECRDSSHAYGFVNDLMFLVWSVRKEVGNDTLPCLVDKLEKNSLDIDKMTFRAVVDSKLEALELFDWHLKLFPVLQIPKEYYCEGHHQTCQAFRISFEDAIGIYQQNHFDFWRK
jgi:hypothetical protein